MTMKSKLQEILILSALMGGNPGSVVRVENISGNLPPKPIPKGCKEYFFSIDGRFSNEQMLRSECVFKCVSMNDKSARKKFNSWKLKHK